MAPSAAKSSLPALAGLGLAESEVEMGKVVGVFGVRGEVRLHLHNRSDSSLLGQTASVVLLSPAGARFSARLTARSGAGGRVIGRLDGVSDVEAATALQDYRVVVARAALPAPGPGEFYVIDLLGAATVTVDGTVVGEVVDVHTTRGGDLVEIRPGTEQHFLALNGPYVLEVDVPGRRVVVDPAGWADE